MGLSNAWSVKYHWSKISGFHLQIYERMGDIFTLATSTCECYAITPSFLLRYWRYELDLNPRIRWKIFLNKQLTIVTIIQFSTLLIIFIDKTIDHASTIWNRRMNVSFVEGILACRSMCSAFVTYFIDIELHTLFLKKLNRTSALVRQPFFLRGILAESLSFVKFAAYICSNCVLSYLWYNWCIAWFYTTTNL